MNTNDLQTGGLTMIPSLETTMQLDCELTDEQVKTIAAQLAVEIPDLLELREEAKESAKEYREKVKKHEGRIEALARKVRYRSMILPVVCRLVPRGDADLVDVVRLDTGEIVQTREMTPHEARTFRQGTLDLEAIEDEAVKRGMAKGMGISILPADDDSEEELGVS